MEAASKEDVIEALGQAGSRLRAELGESLATIEKLDAPLDLVTTASLEALRAYTLGMQKRVKGQEADSIPFFKRAIELDPDFAMAYGSLGVVYENLGEQELANEHLAKAFARRERLRRSEAFYASAHYYTLVTGELHKAAEVYKLWAETDKTIETPHVNLGVIYFQLGEIERALEEALAVMRLDPDNRWGYENAGEAYLALNRLDEAEEVLRQAVAKKLDSVGTHSLLYLVAFLKRDDVGMAREAQWAAGHPEEFEMRHLEAHTAAEVGQLERARGHYDKAVELALRGGFRDRAAVIAASAALTEATSGEFGRARQRVKQALALGRPRDALTLSALALARAGSTQQAERLIVELAERHPTHTIVNSVWAPTVRAAIETARGNPEVALEGLRAAEPYERAYPEAIYTRGQAYLLAGQGTSASAAFQKVLERRGVRFPAWTRPYGLAQLGLARAYALAGGTAKSRAAYEDFFARWKDADPDIPILEQAKAEYARLH